MRICCLGLKILFPHNAQCTLSMFANPHSSDFMCVGAFSCNTVKAANQFLNRGGLCP